MRKSIVFVIVFAILTLACSCLALPGGQPATSVPPTPFRPTVTTGPAMPADQGGQPAVALSGLTIVRVHPAGGGLNDQLATAVASARQLQQDPYIEFGATWCPACQALETSLDEGNPLMVDAFQGIYLVRADVDEWEYELSGSGFDFDAIPILFLLNDQGGPAGAWIDGNAWGANIPENMAPPLKAFFQTH